MGALSNLAEMSGTSSAERWKVGSTPTVGSMLANSFIAFVMVATWVWLKWNDHEE